MYVPPWTHLCVPILYQVRQGLKKFSNWPTYPQLYSKGELIGGLDIARVICSSKLAHLLIRYDLVLIRYDLVLTWYDLVLIRYDLVLTRYDLVLIQYDLVLTWYDLVLIQYDLVLTWYDLCLIHFCYSGVEGVRRVA